MATTNQAYVSKTVPFGGLFIEIFRLADPADNNSGISIGSYLLESITHTISATLNKRPGTDGGKNGWWLITGDVEGAAVIQRAAAATPTLANGDYFSASIRVDANGAGVAERFVIHGVGHSVDSSYRKQNVSVIVDDQV